MGRPTKYTPESAKKITDAIRLGSTYHLACLYAGVDDHSLIRWRHRHPDFDAAVREAEGAGAIGWLAKIERAANDGEWTAAAWKLERRYPQEYGRRVTEVQGPEGGAIPVRIYEVDVRHAGEIPLPPEPGITGA